MNRKDGFYWIKLMGHWRVARYSIEDDVWYLDADETQYNDASFDEINEERILPPLTN